MVRPSSRLHHSSGSALKPTRVGGIGPITRKGAAAAATAAAASAEPRAKVTAFVPESLCTVE